MKAALLGLLASVLIWGAAVTIAPAIRFVDYLAQPVGTLTDDKGHAEVVTRFDVLHALISKAVADANAANTANPSVAR